jgi:hypothetical protein
MFVPFDSMPSSSRLWIYQADKVFNSTQKQILSEDLLAFTNSWTAHGNPMKASFHLPYDHFILLAADEQQTQASGCSIDDSVHTIRAASQKTGIDFLDRTSIAFKKGDTIDLIPVKDLKKGFASGRWDADTLTFNNLITTKVLLSEWVIPAHQTWLKRYLSAKSVNI